MLFNSLVSLISQINNIFNQNTIEVAQKEIIETICENFDANKCVLYLSKHNDEKLYLIKEYSIHKGFIFPEYYYQQDWHQIREPIYMVQPELNKLFSPINTIQKFIILPLHFECQIIGLVLIVLDNNSPTILSPDELLFLKIIAHKLADIYYVYPLLKKAQQNEIDLATLYLKAEQDLEDERKRISLELHDEVGQVLTSILLQLKLLQQSNDIEYMKGRLGGLHHITMETLEEVRRISQHLSPRILQKLGLQSALEAHIKEFIKTTAIEVELRINNLDGQMAEPLKVIVYRAVQEGLTNVARHSGASRVVITLNIKQDHLFLQISDNGKGMQAGVKYNTGLLGMKERVTRSNGKFWLVNEKCSGITVNILLPLK